MFRRSLALLVLTALAMPVFAQDKPKDSSSDSKSDSKSSSDHGSRDHGSRGNFDPARYREDRMNRIKEDLGVSDDEWKVIEPKLQKVMDLRGDQMRAAFMGFRGRDMGSSSSDEKKSAVVSAMEDLRKTLDNKDAKADEIKDKLTALRDAKEKAKTELASAQKELKEILSQRQEAQMVMMGMLD